jgi:DNA-binding beta-propeller fold protein YncE
VGAVACAAALAAAPRGVTRAAEPTAGPAASAAPIDPVVLCTRTRPTEGGRPILGGTGQGGTLALTRWASGATIAYVAHEDDRSLVAVDVDGKKVKATTPLDGAPSNVVVLGDGRIVVALRDKATLQVLEPGATPTSPLRSLCRVSVAVEPVGLAVSPDDRTLVVTSAWGHEVAALDTRSFGVRMQAALPREPRAVVVSDDGQRAFVSHVVDARMSVVDLTSKSPSVRSIDLGVRRDSTPLSGCQGFALAKSVDGVEKGTGERAGVRGDAPPPPRTATPRAPTKAPTDDASKPGPTAPDPAAPSGPDVAGRVFAPMVVVDVGQAGNPGYGNTSRGPTEVPFVGVVDEAAERSLARSMHGDPTLRAAECVLPRAAAFAARQRSLLVACLGSDTVIQLDARGVRMSNVERRRWQVPRGPTGIAVDAAHDRAVVWSQFDGALSTIALDASAAQSKIPVPVSAARALSPELARGRVLFHAVGDARLSKDGRACASCHPDGRDDALTWFTPDGPLQTIMLAGRLDGTAPFSWTGHNATLEKHLDSTMSRLGGRGLSSPQDAADKSALLAYVRAMPAPPAPRLAASERALVARGERLFTDEAQGCATCHFGGGTDHHAHGVDREDVSRGGDKPFDTPSLRFVGGTAPYFHDGRFDTLEALLASPDHAMGATLHLGHSDRVALARYMGSL